MTDTPKPFWQTLRFMLSSLMVLTYYLDRLLVPSAGVEGLMIAFNTTLIPMFVFISGYLSRDITKADIRRSVIPAIITCYGFQMIDTIPLILRGEFSWVNFFIMPLDGVWFILAVPVWQWVSVMNIELRHHPLISFLILFAIGFVGLYWLQPYTGFALTLGYFPIFFLGRRIPVETIIRWRNQSWMVFTVFLLGTVLLFLWCYHYLPLAPDFMMLWQWQIDEALLTYCVFTLFNLLFGALSLYLIRYSHLLKDIAPKSLGVYLIHPILCIIILTLLERTGLRLDLPMAILFTLITITIAVGLASIYPFKWLLAPKLPARKSIEKL